MEIWLVIGVTVVIVFFIIGRKVDPEDIIDETLQRHLDAETKAYYTKKGK